MKRILILVTMMTASAFANKDTYDRMLAAVKENDQPALAEIAKNSMDLEVGRAALDNLKDLPLIVEVAKNSMNMWVGETAVQRLHDQAHLVDIAKNGQNFWARDKALLRLNGDEYQTLFAEIAKTDESLQVRLTAMSKLGDPIVTAEFRVTVPGSWNRREDIADEGIHDQAQLVETAKNDKDKCIRITAVKRLTDQAVLAAIAKDDKDWLVRWFAISKIDNQTLLAEFTENEKDVVVRKEAEKRLALIKAENERPLSINPPLGLVIPETPDRETVERVAAAAAQDAIRRQQQEAAERNEENGTDNK